MLIISFYDDYTQCGEQFNEKRDLTEHEVIHTREKPFRCSQCDKMFQHYCNKCTATIITDLLFPLLYKVIFSLYNLLI